MADLVVFLWGAAVQFQASGIWEKWRISSNRLDSPFEMPMQTTRVVRRLQVAAEQLPKFFVIESLWWLKK